MITDKRMWVVYDLVLGLSLTMSIFALPSLQAQTQTNGKRVSISGKVIALKEDELTVDARTGLEVVLAPPASKPYRTKPRPLGLREGFCYDSIADLLARAEGEDHQ